MLLDGQGLPLLILLLGDHFDAQLNLNSISIDWKDKHNSVAVTNLRERAIEFMLEHTARTRDNIEREVNR